MTTTPSFLTRFSEAPDVEKWCAYFEILYASYDTMWTDSTLLQAKCDALTHAGFSFDKELNLLTDAERIEMFEGLMTTEVLDLMVWWVYEHLGTQWLQYIRGLDLFLNSMRMVGQTVTNPLVEDKLTGKTGEVVEDELWLKKQKVYMEATKINSSLMDQRRALFMGTEAEQKLLEVVATGRSADVDFTRTIKDAKKG